MKILLIMLFPILTFAESPRPQEPLLGVTYDLTGITFQVSSGGCTTKSDFKILQIGPSPLPYLQITLVREAIDLCPASPLHGITIKFTYEEMGIKKGTEFVISNPVVTGVIRR